MKIRCDVCERAEAAVVCCADEAALCWSCDEKVHAANKVARKHQRVPLLPRGCFSSSSNFSHPSSSSSASSEIPACDICQERGGYFFCLEDRALLCRQCDVSTHTASPYVSSHQRFLITGVKVALEECRLDSDSSSNKNNNSSSSSNCCNSKNPLSSLASASSVMSEKPEGDQVGYAVENMESLRPQWSWNEFFDGVEFEQCYGLSEPGSSN